MIINIIRIISLSLYIYIYIGLRRAALDLSGSLQNGGRGPWCHSPLPAGRTTKSTKEHRIYTNITCYYVL